MGIFDNLKGRLKKGEVNSNIKHTGRNDVCWCGSGIKYKKCHLEEDEKRLRAAQKDSCGNT